MKKIWLLVFSVALIGVGVYFVKNYLFYDLSLNNIVPAIKLPGKDIRQYLPQNHQIAYPFSIKTGYVLDVFADMGGNLPRALAWDPNGTLVVSATKKGKVSALPDADRNGKADQVIEIVSGLNKPHGIAFDRDWIYIAETDKVSRYSYSTSSYTASFPQVLFTLPGGGRHYTRTIRIHDGKLYTSVGSSCDVCVENDEERATILVSNLDGTEKKVFAKGLRNTVFFVFDKNGNMWGADMGRDGLGDNLPPDELNIIEEGKDYGWPYCYGNRVRDISFKSGQQTSYCISTEPSIYNFQAHVAPLGLAFIDSSQFSSGDQNNLLVAFHGSWNRSSPVGYSIEKLNIFANNVSSTDRYLYGWLRRSEVFGRPVDLIFSDNGKLFISDDNAGLIYIYSKGG